MANIYLHVGGQRLGPYQDAQLREMLKSGLITASTSAWHEGLEDWQPVSTLIGFTPDQDLPPNPAPMEAMQGHYPVQSSNRRKVILIASFVCGLLIFCVLVMAGLAVLGIGWGASQVRPPNLPSSREMTQLSGIDQTNRIAAMMAHYADDHSGSYPDGQSSTEVFQMLLDGGYAQDAAIFYIEMPGKTPATSRNLTPQNVCFDVTGGVTAKSTGRVPVVFSTGYVLEYAPGTNVELDDGPDSPPLGGILVTYKDGVGGFDPYPVRKPRPGGKPSVFIDDDFNAANETFRQLKP